MRVTAAQLRAYGEAAAAACRAAGVAREAQRQAFRRRIVREEAGAESVKDVRSQEAYDAVMARLWEEAGDYGRASHYRISAERRQAYVVRVLATQLMQLKGGDEAGAQAYVGGVLDQAKVPNGRRLDDATYWMDVSPARLAQLVQILDTERRRLLRRAGASRLSFSDRVRYEADGPVLVVQGVPRGHYDDARVRVNVRTQEADHARPQPHAAVV